MHFNCKIAFLYCVSIGYSFSGMAQEDPTEEMVIEQLLEANEDLFEGEVDLAEVSEYLERVRKYPIDLNQTNGDDLLKLQFISPLHVQRILEHRKKAGRFLSVYELQAIDGLDMQLVQFLLPFITVNPTASLKGIRPAVFLKEGEHDLMIRYGRIIQAQQGYRITDTTRSRYLGTPDRLFFRYRYQLGRDLLLAVNMKKDAGEQFFAGAQRYGFDFYSASLAVRNQGKVRQLIVGDFSLQFGQGLSMWNGMGFGKSVMLATVAKQGRGLQAYTSSNEVFFLRGAAATVDVGNLAVTPFVSRRNLTASVQSDLNNQITIGTLGQSGLHRTPNEVGNRNVLQQWVYGVNVQYQQGQLKLGSTLFETRFNGEIMPTDVLRNRFAFSGRSLINSSIYYQYSFRNIHLFGEAAYQGGGGVAGINGALASLHPELSLLLLYRHYQKDYHSFFSRGLAEGSVAANEQGFLSGLIYHPNRRIEWAFYADFFRFPWLRYRVDAPSQGMDLLSQFSYSWYKRARVYIRYRYRHRQENAQLYWPENRVVDVLRHQIRLDARYKLGDNWQMRNRIEAVHYDKETRSQEWGWLAYHDIFYNRMGSRWTANGRIAFFETGSYDSRLYAFENDVLYGYSIPVYQDKGLRYYINMRYRLFRKADLWLRYASSFYSDKQEVGTGLERIDGHTRSDIKVQFRVRF